MHAQSLQSCPILCDPMDCSPPGSSVYGILQARILEWVHMPSSRESSLPRDRNSSPASPALQVDSCTELPGMPMIYCEAKLLSHVRLFAIPWTIACQAPLSMGFSRQELCSGLPCPPPEDLPDPGIEPESFMSPALAGEFFTTRATWEARF